MPQELVDRSQIGAIDADSLQTYTVGTGANNILKLDGSALLPAVDGSQLTNVDAATLGSLSVGAGANNIVQRDGFGNIDADTLSGQSIGTGANNIVQLNGSSALPAVDGSNLTNLPTPAAPAYGGVGSFGMFSSSTTVTPGQIVAGNALTPSDAAGNTFGGARSVSEQWRAMGTTTGILGASVTVFVRVS